MIAQTAQIATIRKTLISALVLTVLVTLAFGLSATAASAGKREKAVAGAVIGGIATLLIGGCVIAHERRGRQFRSELGADRFDEYDCFDEPIRR